MMKCSRTAWRSCLSAGLVMSFIATFLVVDSKVGGAKTNSSAPVESALRVRSMNGVRYGVRAPIHVLRFSGSIYSLAIGLANHEINGGLETPSSMCRSTPGCVAAVNGDFFDLTSGGSVDPGDEVGGIIQNCVLLHTPEIPHQQVNLGTGAVSQGLNWSSSFDINGVTVPVTAINQQLPMSYSNVNISLTGNVLFTSPYALRTPSVPSRVTYEFAEVNGSGPPTAINTTVELKLIERTPEPISVGTGYVDVSTPVGSPFSMLQIGDNVTLTTTSSAGCNNIGGHPILLDNGKMVPISRADTYMTERFARTVVGWTNSGETVLMSVGGVDHRTGATGYQLDRLLRSLHVVTALDLDGGNSTVLYANGHIYYHWRRAERPVSTGLLVVMGPS